MPTKDPRIDAYIAKAAPFARPILTHIRAVVHAAWPTIEETTKWGVPHFMHHGIVCSMAAFKEHAVFGFWKGALITGPGGKSVEAMGSFGRLMSIDDLPSKRTLIAYVRKAAELNASGAKVPRPTKHTPAKALRVPADLTRALSTNAKARAFFDTLPPSQRRDYIEWITEAKRPETKAKRLATTVEWLAQHKIRNWRYV